MSRFCYHLLSVLLGTGEYSPVIRCHDGVDGASVFIEEVGEPGYRWGEQVPRKWLHEGVEGPSTLTDDVGVLIQFGIESDGGVPLIRLDLWVCHLQNEQKVNGLYNTKCMTITLLRTKQVPLPFF